MYLLIAAAGSGRRMGAKGNKLLLPLAGRPLLSWTLEAAVAAHSVSWIGVVGQLVDKPLILPLLKNLSKPAEWINGGDTRQQSVQFGLAALPKEAKHVLIHDGARCLVEPSLIDKCAEFVLKGEAVIAATPVTDTIKRVDEHGFISSTPDRDGLWAAQTPQGFSVAKLKNGHQQALEKGWAVTDDASLFERLGWSVRILESCPSNIKVTTPSDLAIAEAFIARLGN